MNDLRKCEIQSFISLRNENSIGDICYFHKWFEGKDINEQPAQFAIVEYDDGTVRKIDIAHHRLRFLSKDELSKMAFEKIYNLKINPVSPSESLSSSANGEEIEVPF